VSPSTGSVASQQLVAANLPTELAAKLKEINAPPTNNMGIIDVAARIKVCSLRLRTYVSPVFPDILKFCYIVFKKLAVLMFSISS